MAVIITRLVFEQLFKTHYESLCRSVYRILRDKAAAEDIVQDVYYTIWDNRKDLGKVMKLP